MKEKFHMFKNKNNSNSNWNEERISNFHQCVFFEQKKIKKLNMKKNKKKSSRRSLRKYIIIKDILEKW